jgi:hypothetical protein
VPGGSPPSQPGLSADAPEARFREGKRAKPKIRRGPNGETIIELGAETVAKNPLGMKRYRPDKPPLDVETEPSSHECTNTDVETEPPMVETEPPEGKTEPPRR